MKMIRNQILGTLVLATLLSGCTGMRFRDAVVNQPLPQDWEGRVLMNNPADFRYYMKENIGLLVTPNSDKTYSVISKPITPNAFTAREDTIKDGSIYSSRITSAASAKGGYLTFAAKFSSSDALNFQIVDVSRADIPWAQFPDTKIRKAAAQANPTGMKRLWIQSLILSRIVKNSAAKVECDISGAGPAFQVGATCFNESDSVSNDWAIAAVLFDIDKYVAENPAGIPALGAPAAFSVRSQPSESIANQISKIFDFLGKQTKKINGEPTLPEYISAETQGYTLTNFQRE